MRVRPLYLVILVLIGGSIFLVYSALAPSINPYLSISQVRCSSYAEREVQVLANLDDWSVDEKGGLVLRLSDGNATMNVTYHGLPPQGLTRGQKIVAIGVLHPPDGLDATRLLVKCPSKYE
jgi:cytochrome c-type biogenesis protein CcmE